MRRLSGLLRRRAPRGARKAQVLGCVREGALRSGEVARTLGIHPAAASALLGYYHRRGLLKRRRGPGGYEYSITGKGLRWLKAQPRK